MTRVINAVVKHKHAVPKNFDFADHDEGESVQIVIGKKTARDWYMGYFGIIGGVVAAILSLILGGLNQLEICTVSDACALFIVGFWVLVPPVFLWIDWVYYCPALDTKDLRDEAKHTHNLARNIWLALSVVLVSLFKINSIINL